MSEKKKIRVIQYDKDLLSRIRDERIVLKTDTLEELEEQYREAMHDKEVVAVVVDLPYASISEIQWLDGWETIPLVVRAYNVGDYYALLRVLPILRRLNLRVYLSNANDKVFSDLKFLSSLGVDCGLMLNEGVEMSDDLFLDFASYYYLSKGRHASVEPFEFILRHLNDDRNTSFSAIYFEDPVLFSSSVDDAGEETSEFAEKLHSYYSHFMDLDKCATCPAFKICDHKMLNKLADCAKSMEEIFDMAEIRNQLNDQENHQKTICQL